MDTTEREKRRLPETLREACGAEELKYVAFLYENMPLLDLYLKEPSFFLKVVRQALKVRRLTPWRELVSEELFRHYVLPYRVNDEMPEFWQESFFDEAFDRVKDKTLYEAAVEMNYWCLEKAVYRSTDDRTGSPLTVVNRGFGRCGEESTLAVAAMRSVGIPARQCYAPRWSHCDDNHAWVEVFTGDGWHYLGACEPEGRLDVGWFQLAASKAMLIHTFCYTDRMTEEGVLHWEGHRAELNRLAGGGEARPSGQSEAVETAKHTVTPRYAVSKPLCVEVCDEAGCPVEGARVRFEVVNFSEFAAVATLLTDAAGKAVLETGLGDILIHAEKDGIFAHEKADVRKKERLRLILKSGNRIEREAYSFRFVPPAGGETLETAQGEPDAAFCQREKERKAAADAVREKRLGTFYDGVKAAEYERLHGLAGAGKYLMEARGNYGEIERFLEETPAPYKELAVKLLGTLTSKDLADVRACVLSEWLADAAVYMEQARVPEKIGVPYLLCPRIGNENLTAFKQALLQTVTKERLASFSQKPETVWDWLREHILWSEPLKPLMRPLLQPPAAVLRAGEGDGASRRILAAAILRKCGVPARLERADGAVSFYENGRWIRLGETQARREGCEPARLVLVREEGSFLQYDGNVTVGRLEEGCYRTLDFRDLEWERERLVCPVRPGMYRVIVTNRQPDGSLDVQVDFAEVKSGATVEHFLRQNRGKWKLGTILQEHLLRDREGCGTALSGLLQAGKRHLVCWLDPGKEPTEHLLNELMEAASFLEKQEGRKLLLVKEAEGLNATLQTAVKTIHGVELYVEPDFEWMKETENFGLQDKRLPLAVVTEGTEGIYAFSGYQVGCGEMICKGLECD